MTNLQVAAPKVVIIIGCLILAALTFPLINLIQPRQHIPVEPAVAADYGYMSNLLQEKCSDCHTPNKTDYPFYFSWPIAHQIVSQDIAHAQNSFIVTADQLSGKTPLDPTQIAQIGVQIRNNTMPPLKYKMVHWKAFITAGDRKETEAWLERHKDSFSLKPIPLQNPFHPDAKKIALGSRLFHEKRLSADNTISCATCHVFSQGGADHLVTATGIHDQHGPINIPTVFNAAFNFRQFWDGRAADLEEQAGGPVNNPLEMGSNWPQVISKLQQDSSYVIDFKQTYVDGINSKNITNAIASYEQTLLTPNCKFDRLLSGDQNALTYNEKKGYELFQKYNCASCHNGVNFGGTSFQKMGIHKDYFVMRGHLTHADNGRFNITQLASDMHKFKVPTLRNIEATAPYFHDGSVNDLSQAVHIMAEYQTGHIITNQESLYIVAFLKTLTGEYGGKKITDITPPHERLKP